MNEKNFDIYLEFNYLKLNLAAFNKLNGKLEFYKEKSYKLYFEDNNKLNFDELQKFVEESILELEKSIDYFVKDIYLMIETPQSTSIKLSVVKNNEGKKLIKEDAIYLIQDAKQLFLKSNKDSSIIHIIVENYVLDNINYNFFPIDRNCNKFSIDIKFICLPKILIKKFEKLFSKQQIYVNKFICSNYVKRFEFKNNNKNLCERGRDIIEGINKQEVVSIPKTIKKTGFFEKLFHLFR